MISAEGRREWEGAGRKEGEFPFTEYLGEPAMMWKLLLNTGGGWKRSDKKTTSQKAFEPSA